MPAPIAVQLYTVRQALARDFAGIMKRLADIGYIGVESAGFPGTTPKEAANTFSGLGLVVSSAHMPLPLGEHKNEALDAMKELGCKRMVSGMGPEAFKTLDQTKRSCDTLNEASAVAAENGLTFGIHNHWWEFQQVEGRRVYEIMLDHLDRNVFFEIDTYWAQTGGADPAEIVKGLGKRAPLLHIKDGPCVVGEPMVAVGEGTMDFPSIVSAAGDSTEWMIVELDECATDMMEAVEKSYRYLIQNGLARGNRD